MRRRDPLAAPMRRAAEAGSVFVESIISAAIVAMALGATYRVISDSAGRDRAAATRREALLIAQSELADVGADIPLRAGDVAGQAGDMVWRVEISPYGDAEEKNPVGILWRVDVSVSPRRGGARLVSLQTLRLGSGA